MYRKRSDFRSGWTPDSRYDTIPAAFPLWFKYGHITNDTACLHVLQHNLASCHSAIWLPLSLGSIQCALMVVEYTAHRCHPHVSQFKCNRTQSFPLVFLSLARSTSGTAAGVCLISEERNPSSKNYLASFDLQKPTSATYVVSKDTTRHTWVSCSMTTFRVTTICFLPPVVCIHRRTR